MGGDLGKKRKWSKKSTDTHSSRCEKKTNRKKDRKKL